MEPGTGLPSRKSLDLEDLRQRLGDQRGPALWRSLEEVAETAEFQELVEREFPQQAAEWDDSVSRRRFLQLMSASLAFGGLTACTRQPLERIVPFVQQPEELVPGKPLYFATAIGLGGFAAPVLAESHMGRPTKLEGNPEHPASRGATDLFTQAAVLDLYDPDRMQTVRGLGRIKTWQEFTDSTVQGMRALDALGGARLRVLTGTVTSPSLAAMIQRLLEERPRARWHQWEPAAQHGARLGARLAFGRDASVRYDLSRADVVVALDADFLTQGPGAVRNAREFVRGRRVRVGATEMSRLYALESTPTGTGSLADHRVPLSTAEIARFALALAEQLEVPGVGPAEGPSEQLEATLRSIVRDLDGARGRSAVVAGDSAPPALHAVALAINAALGNLGSTVLVSEPIEAEPVDQAASVTELAEAMRAGEVDVLLILGGNPVYDAPADLDLGGAMRKVTRCIYLGSHDNETAELCHWTLPAAHDLESWGDARSDDGTVTFTQPLIEPLYDGRSALEVLSLFTEEGERPGEELLRAHWQEATDAADFERWWRRTLHDGFVPDSAPAPLEPTLSTEEVRRATASLAGRTVPSTGAPELTLRPDPTIWDGRFANNGWLQECPKPLSKLTWDNAALISPALAQSLGLANGQVVRLLVGEQGVAAPVWIHPGQAPATVTLALGYGRRRAGRVGSGVGVDAYPLRASTSLWGAERVVLQPTSEIRQLASTQMHSNIELETVEAGRRELVRRASLERYLRHPEFAHDDEHADEQSLMRSWSYDGYAWGMSVDLSACTGCNACVIACQAENNIPVVGKDQVQRGREMHWIRIDRYYGGDLDAPSLAYQPVLCMHCEQAPCEVVCPVAATSHSDEGLNDMVYNRCVGTRYCSNNCPYKVRRFNFLVYNDYDTPVLELLRNPDVTVRSRGVMEKCSYCVQRINGARITSRREDRAIRDGEIQTACQQVCPTEALVFGDLNDPASRVSRRKAQPTDYSLLGELGTRPRTTYLARIDNPHPDLGGGHTTES